jgi:hypothetical protein
MIHIHLGVERSVDICSKAFDSMSHDFLLLKLRFKFGLSSTACRLFGSFLGPWTQKVVMIITIGRPPILFACFINDVGNYIRNYRCYL